MKAQERFPKVIVEKHDQSICFMVDKFQCHMEAAEPRIVWIMRMGYELDSIMLELYAQHPLIHPIDNKEERFGTFKEKELSLHKKFNDAGRKRKIKKEEEVVANRWD